MVISSVELPFSQLSSLCASFLAGMTMTRCVKALVPACILISGAFQQNEEPTALQIAFATLAAPRFTTPA